MTGPRQSREREGHTPPALTAPELEARIAAFVATYLPDRSPETVGTYRRALNELIRYVPRRRGRFIFEMEEVEEYKRYLAVDRGFHQVSVSTYLTALRRFCQYLVDVGLLFENPAQSVKGNRRPESHSRETLTEQEVVALPTHVDGSTMLGKRDLAIMHLMLHAGLSEIEIVRADVQDLEQTLLGWFLRVQGKGRLAKDRQVPVDPSAMAPLRVYLEARGRVGPEAALFVSHGNRSEGERLNTRSVRSRIRYHMLAAGIRRPGVSPHSLTHTAALIWLNNGMAVEEVRDRMRHGTLDTTMISFRRKGLLRQGQGSGDGVAANP